MEMQEVTIHVNRDKISRREQYAPKEKKSEPKRATHYRAKHRRRNRDNSRFWKFATASMAILLVFSIYLNHKAMSLVEDLQNDLQNSITSMTEMQEAYKQLGSMYLAEKELREQQESTANQPPQMLENNSDVIYAVDRQITTVETPVEDPAPLFPEQFNEVPLDAELIAYIYQAAMTADIKPEIFFALAWKESNFTPYNLVSSTNDYGMFQINQCNFGTIAEHFGIAKSEVPQKLLSDPYFCADCSIYILTTIIETYGPGDYHQLLMTYNMGPGNAAKCFNRGYYTSEYSRKVVNYASENYDLTDASL